MAAKKRKRRKKRPAGTAAIILILFALAAGIIILVRMFTMGARQALNPQPSAEVSATPTPPPTLPPSRLAAECFGKSDGYITYESETQTAKQGIDISAFQGGIDWETVADSGVDYAIIRAGYRSYGYGDIEEDDLFAANLEQASAAGLDVGVYFFSQAIDEEEARLEAEAVLGWLDGFPLTYPVYFDWEPISDAEARTDTISASELTRCAKTFCQTIEAGGYEAGIYFNLAMAAHHYHLYELREYSFWLAEYQDIPSFPYAFDLWQYTNEGEVPGIYTSVDLGLSFVSPN